MSDQLDFDAVLGEAAEPVRRARAASHPRARREGRTPPGRHEVLLAPAGARARTTRAARDRLDAGRIAELLHRPAPTPEQRDVIEAAPGPLLVVAGAGSGKTETMAARVVWLVVNGYAEPEDVLGLTFTRKAAGELGERIRARLRSLHRLGVIGPPSPVTVSTYNAYAGGLLRDHGLRIGIEPGAGLLGEAAAWQLMDAVVERWPDPMPEVEAARSTVVEAVLAMAGECADHLADPAIVELELADVVERLAGLPAEVGGAVPGRPSAGVREVIERLMAKQRLVALVEAYRARKAEQGLLDFGDQVALAAQIAGDHEVVVAAERERYRIVLLDEYQDTSHAQEVLLRTVFGDGHHVAAVGDPFQSIYGWRGASSGNLARFRQAFAARPVAAGPDLEHRAEVPVRHLSTSWRNDALVLDVAHAVSEELRPRERDVVRLVPRPGAGAGRVEVHWHATIEDEARAIAQFAVDRLRGAGAAEEKAGRTMAVLCRTRSQFPYVEGALRARGLPVEVVGLGGLLHVPEIADLRAALEVIHDPERGDALMRLLTGPSVDLGPRDVDALGVWAAATSARTPGQDSSIVEALDHLPPPDWQGRDGEQLSPAGRDRLERLSRTLRALRAQTGLPLVELVCDVERALLLDVEVAARTGASASGARAHLDAFVDVAGAFADRGAGRTLGSFLRWLDVAADQERGLDAGLGEPRPDAIQIATVHAAKGLEWDVVAVAGLVEGTFPEGTGGREVPVSKGWLGAYGAVPYVVRGDAEDLPRFEVAGLTSQPQATAALIGFTQQCGLHELAEERRLAYVAVTRARSALLLSGAMWGEGSKPRVPSRFLLEAAAVPGAVRHTWESDPEDGAANPRAQREARVAWPVDLLGDRRPAIEEGAALVRAAADRPAVDRPAVDRPAGDRPVLDRPAANDGVADRGEWDEEIDLLLAERELHERADPTVELPLHLSVSRVVALAEDPQALALQLRRPLPARPSAGARRGSAFHAWLEQRFASAALVDIDELNGAEDDALTADEELDALRESFLASEWAQLSPTAVEVAVETPVAGITVRGRIDAVYLHRTSRGARWDVVDWKTGEPSGPGAARARAVQLAVYRLAWARLQGVPVEEVDAAFFYAATGRTVRPVGLLDEAGLESLIRDATAAPEAPGPP